MAPGRCCRTERNSDKAASTAPDRDNAQRKPGACATWLPSSSHRLRRLSGPGGGLEATLQETAAEQQEMPACSGDVTGRGSGRGGPMVMSARTRTRWAAEQRMADGKRERPGRGVCTTRRRAPRSRGKRMKRDGAHVSDILRNAAAVQALAARRVKRRSSTRGESDDSTRLTAVPPLLALSLAGPWLRLVEAAAQYGALPTPDHSPKALADHVPLIWPPHRQSHRWQRPKPLPVGGTTNLSLEQQQILAAVPVRPVSRLAPSPPPPC